ncbi:MAG: hypothetical protein HRT65_10320 [Flavobacteriaceae bacterium]|nr:hypothetical protein [Flavobacteriaceae bacterium]
MKLSLIGLVMGLCLTLFASCSEDAVETDIQNEGENTANEPVDSNDDTVSDPGTTVTLNASASILSNNGEGLQQWVDGVSLRALNIDGSEGRLVFDTEFRDHGFGVGGARWQQIDYYVMYQGQEVNASEKIEIFFDSPVQNVVLTVGMMGANEGHQDGETGKWTAFNGNGAKIAEGVLGANDSMLGREVKSVENSYGTYPIALSIGDPVHSLQIEATGFGYGEGEPKNVNSYDNDSGNKENNSDFNLVAIRFEYR